MKSDMKWKIGYNDGSGMGDDANNQSPTITMCDEDETIVMWGGSDDWGCKRSTDVETAHQIVREHNAQLDLPFTSAAKEEQKIEASNEYSLKYTETQPSAWQSFYADLSHRDKEVEELRSVIAELVRLEWLRTESDYTLEQFTDYHTNAPLAWAKAKQILEEKP